MPKYKAYAVLVGKKTGVFTSWLDVQPLVHGVSGPRFQGFPDWTSAKDAFEDAYMRGETRIVKDGPPKTQRPKQEPRRGAGTPYTTSLSSAGRAARDAIIAAALEEARRETQHNSAGGGKDDIHRPSTRSMTRAQAQTTQHVPAREPESKSLPGPRPAAQGERNSKSTSSNPSTSSSPPTGVTQVKTSSESAQSPRYAQSLSYASDASPTTQVDVHMVSPATGSSALASSDRRSDVSLPSTGVTKYFPADFATRPRDAYIKMRESGASNPPVRSPATTVSEYETPSGSAQTQQFNLSPLASGNPMPPPATPSTIVSPPATPVSTGTKTRRRKVGKDYSDASIQVDRPTRKRVYVPASIQASHERQYTAAELHTSPAQWESAIPPRSASGVSDAQGECGCENPAHVCRHCGLPPRVMQSVANRIATPTLASPVSVASPASRSSVASPAPRPAVASLTRRSSGAPTTACSSITTLMSFSSPLAYTELASSPPSSSVSGSPASFHSAQSSPGGHTPLLGTSERRSGSIASAASLQEGLNALVRSTPARNGASAVMHDISFDPRSPIQRGTMIPAGTGFNSFVRPSPTLAPLDSLLFS